MTTQVQASSRVVLNYRDFDFILCHTHFLFLTFKTAYQLMPKVAFSLSEFQPVFGYVLKYIGLLVFMNVEVNNRFVTITLQ
jgi:hypothetical protein